MSLPIFPFTDVKPTFNSDPEDVILRSPPDAGKIITRAKFTKARETLSGVVFELYEGNGVNDLKEKTALDLFFNETVGKGALPFTLNLNLNGTIKTYPSVIFLSPPKSKYVGMGCWDVEITVQEL